MVFVFVIIGLIVMFRFNDENNELVSHGIENLKSMMLALSDQSNDSFDILVMNNNGKPEKISVFIEDDKIKVQ